MYNVLPAVEGNRILHAWEFLWEAAEAAALFQCIPAPQILAEQKEHAQI